MKILYPHGWHSVPGGVKPTFLAQHGHEVLNPSLSDEDFAAAVQVAQAELERHQPDVIVGSSRGAAVAINLDSGDTPLVLLCPAWKKWGTAKTVKPSTVILRSRADDVVPFSDTEELVRKSGLPVSARIEVGSDHRLADPEPLATRFSENQDSIWRDLVRRCREIAAWVVPGAVLVLMRYAAVTTDASSLPVPLV
jgi:hypothetical protein